MSPSDRDARTDEQTDDQTDAALAALPVPPMWKRIGLHGPAITFRWILANGKRIVVFVAGVVVVLAGVVMLVLPGPGLLVIIGGLAILGTEFAWAERALDAAKARASKAGAAVTSRVRRPKR